MLVITQTKTTYLKKPNTKTDYNVDSIEVETLSENEYDLAVNTDESAQWFRRIGGSETAVLGYTCIGFKTIRLTSGSADLQKKIVKEFKFEWIENNYKNIVTNPNKVRIFTM